MNLSDVVVYIGWKYKGSLVFFPKDQFVKKANQIFLLGFCEEIVGAWTNLEDEDSQKLWRRGFCMRMRTSTKSFFFYCTNVVPIYTKKIFTWRVVYLLYFADIWKCWLRLCSSNHFATFAIFCGLFYARIFFACLLLQ